MTHGPAWAQLARQPAADALLESVHAGRDRAIVRTACVDLGHPLPPRELVRLAQINADKKRTWDSLETLGAAQYRSGRFQEALATLAEAVQRHPQGGSTWTKLFLALTSQQRGQPQKARAWLDKAKLGPQASWQERLIGQRLSEEAGQLLKREKK